ncbi:VWA domain-containing protein [Oceanobacillus piezotolerans]|uniref:VWA domain-containing protein n=1 Tax=Oceanobacillus piezotolerans TaxID=2448030 RepID=A0A498D4E2_9BACI|nr:VWA domain-containing protein [Oceanobacillus piezotolerans]RLL41671.1 VWA domain-containing protein [Oceanobacillus piezotolerans]
MKKGTLKQILLITDGCSNKGEDPSEVAALAFEQGIAVNVIGILDEGYDEDVEGLREVEDIATAGGGVSQIVYPESLSQTIQMVTRQAMTQTIQGFVNQELKQILGREQTLDDVAPEKRGEIIEVVEDISETSNLEVLVLVDTSASMHDKLPTVKESLIDLSISLNSRIGKNLFCVYSFPGKRKDIQKILDWSPKLDSISSVFPKLTSGGITPTGPAIREAINQFSKKTLLRSFKNEDPGAFEA